MSYAAYGQEAILGRLLVEIFQGTLTEDTISLVKTNISSTDVPMPLKHIVSFVNGLATTDMAWIKKYLLDEMRIIAIEQTRPLWPEE